MTTKLLKYFGLGKGVRLNSLLVQQCISRSLHMSSVNSMNKEDQELFDRIERLKDKKSSNKIEEIQDKINTSEDIILTKEEIQNLKS